MNVLSFFTIWTMYVLLGITWLSYFLKRNKIQSENMIGSLFIVCGWPIHILYKIIKKI